MYTSFLNICSVINMTISSIFYLSLQSGKLTEFCIEKEVSKHLMS